VFQIEESPLCTPVAQSESLLCLHKVHTFNKQKRKGWEHQMTQTVELKKIPNSDLTSEGDPI
jgi:hypothetical protein